ncbi:hypothetical protein HA49_15245 [Tatumella morbirosei]|uniref:Mig-14 family protein n=1 Tax=Tatumella morbirosei TaxID=642227 RepID=A0A095UCH9_9GAMM|nr:hypothetical protein [Tatumella morbirosei]KGD72123.1 hypothetical protein HA49_15245 [Tatumella morbirosei]
MSQIKRVLYGWKTSDASIYELCYKRYGGSVNMHPDVIRFFATLNSQPVAYYHKERNGEYIAAYALLATRRIGVEQWKNFPLSYDEIMIPIARGETIFFPEKANKISHFNKGNFRNVNFSFARKTKVCFAKNSYSSKTEKNRRNEYNRFLRAGGRCCDLSQYSTEELADFYIFLFRSRFTDKLECYSRENLITIIRAMKKMVFGHILFIENEPCAMDLIFMAESDSIAYFDVPNGGINMKYTDLSPGSLLMWKNITSAREYCAITGKEMRFSMGSLGKNWTYKLRWADALKTGKTIF